MCVCVRVAVRLWLLGVLPDCFLLCFEGFEFQARIVKPKQPKLSDENWTRVRDRLDFDSAAAAAGEAKIKQQKTRGDLTFQRACHLLL